MGRTAAPGDPRVALSQRLRARAGGREAHISSREGASARAPWMGAG
jgi:hypothetical protein